MTVRRVNLECSRRENGVVPHRFSHRSPTAAAELALPANLPWPFVAIDITTKSYSQLRWTMLATAGYGGLASHGNIHSCIGECFS